MYIFSFHSNNFLLRHFFMYVINLNGIFVASRLFIEKLIARLSIANLFSLNNS